MRALCDVRSTCDELVVYTNEIQMLAIQMRLDRVKKTKETKKKNKQINDTQTIKNEGSCPPRRCRRRGDATDMVGDVSVRKKIDEVYIYISF